MNQVLIEDNKVIGEIVDGEFKPVPPVPEGEDFDECVIDCCNALTKHPKMKGRLDGLAPVDGKFPDALLDEMTVWIEQGSLREQMQINKAVVEFNDYQSRLVALGTIETNWKLTPFGLRQWRWYFRVPDAAPLPTRRQILEDRERRRQQEEEASRRHAEEDREFRERMRAKEAAERQAYEASPVGQVVIGILGPEPEKGSWDYNDDKKLLLPYVTLLTEQCVWKPEAIVKQWLEVKQLWSEGFVKFDDGDPEFAEFDEYPECNECCFRILLQRMLEPAVWGATEIPPQGEGVIRIPCATQEELSNTLRGLSWAYEAGRETVLRMAPDRSFVLDVLPKGA